MRNSAGSGRAGGDHHARRGRATISGVGVLSVVTPVYRPQPEHLRAAYAALAEQHLPAGWTWEWLVQEDGRTGVARKILPDDDPRIRFGEGRHGGAALTRNLALARSRGELIRNLDEDDVLTPGALTRDVEILAGLPDVGWTTSRALDLLPDRSTVEVDQGPPPGLLAPGAVAALWRGRGYRLPVHPTTICIRRSLAIALGGWMGVPGSEDTGLLVAASTVRAGFFRGEVGVLYRKWPGQQTAGASHDDSEEWRLRMSIIDERAAALTALFGAKIPA
jgi:hypothetical protein